MVHGAWILVPGTQEHGSWFMVHGAIPWVLLALDPGAWFMVHAALVHGSWFKYPGFCLYTKNCMNI